MKMHRRSIGLSNIIAMAILVVATIPLAFILVDKLEASITPFITSSSPPLVFAYGRLIDDKLVITISSESSILEKAALNLIYSNGTITSLRDAALATYTPGSGKIVAVLRLVDKDNLPLAIELVFSNGDTYVYKIIY